MNAKEILEMGIALVTGDRAKTHGPVRENQNKIAILQSAFLEIRREPAAPLSPVDVALLNACQKMARTQSGEHNIDDYVDGANYFAIAGALAEEDNPE